MKCRSRISRGPLRPFVLVFAVLFLPASGWAQDEAVPSLPPYLSYALDPSVEHPRYADDPSQYHADLEALRKWVEAGQFELETELDGLELQGETPTRAEADALAAARFEAFGESLWNASELTDRSARQVRLEEVVGEFFDLLGRPLPPAVAERFNTGMLRLAKTIAQHEIDDAALSDGASALRLAGGNPMAWMMLSSATFAFDPSEAGRLRVIALADVALALDPGLIDARVTRWAAATVAEDYALAVRDGFWVLEIAATMAPEQWERVHELQDDIVLNWLAILVEKGADDAQIDGTIRDYLAWYSPERRSAFFADRLNASKDPVGRARYLVWQEGVMPTDLKAVRLKLVDYVGAENNEAAVKLANRVVRANPERASALVVRAELSHSLGEAEKALEDLDAALQMEPALSDAAVLKASIFFEGGNAVSAEDTLDRALAEAPYNPVLRYMRADLRAQTDRLEDALVDLDMAVAYAAPSEVATVRFQRGKVRAAMGDRFGAAEDMVYAIETSGADASIALEAGKLLEEWELPAFAKRCYRIAAEAGNGEAASLLELLELNAPESAGD